MAEARRRVDEACASRQGTSQVSPLQVINEIALIEAVLPHAHEQRRNKQCGAKGCNAKANARAT
ncbi:hypothetical protein [Bradyrhizobium sp. AZCC 2230]|uniref:hypothetical protein n=1 Tax=Bradyrhizobium sp. AZCC 2230 TaxID=3117021 RepID=UPI002FF0E26D